MDKSTKDTTEDGKRSERFPWRLFILTSLKVFVHSQFKFNTELM